MREIRDRIRHARRMRKLSQEQLAVAVGVHRSSAAQWESVNGTTPSASHLATIATATGVAFEWLATGRGPRDANTDDWVPAARLDDFALDDIEQRLLHAVRKLPARRREAFTSLLELLVTD